MTVLQAAGAAVLICAWAFAGPVALVLVTILLPGLAADRIRARRRTITGEDHHDT